MYGGKGGTGGWFFVCQKTKTNLKSINKKLLTAQ